MAKHSEEGGVEGLGWIEAKILKFKILIFWFIFFFKKFILVTSLI